MITVVNATFFGEERPNLIKLPQQPQFDDVEYKFFTNKPEMVEGDSWKIIHIDQQDDLDLTDYIAAGTATAAHFNPVILRKLLNLF